MTFARKLRDARYRLELHMEVAEYRLRHQGIRPELLAYLRAITLPTPAKRC